MVSGRWRAVTLLSVLLACAMLSILANRLRSSQKALDATRAALVSQRSAIAVNREAVVQLCRTNSVIRGLVAETVDLRLDELRAGDVPRSERARYRENVAVLGGYLARLGSQTGCRARP